MRRFEPTKGNYLTGVRDESNGPVIRAHFKTVDDNGHPFIVPYKVAKPYLAVVANKPEYEMIGTSQLPKDVCPDVSEVVYNIFNGRKDLRSSLFVEQVDLDYAINGAIESSQAYGELLMLVTASEAKQTIRMIRSLFIRVFNIVLDIYNAVKRLNVVATIDMITDIWLEYRYGWRPFIGEIENIHKALTVVRPLGVKSAYGLHKSVAKPDTINQLVIIERDGFQLEVEASLTFKGNPTCKAGFNYMNKPNSRNDSWSAIFGLDFASLASTAWEVVPFSFIIDMFLNLGNALQARDFADQVSSFNGYITCQSTITVEAQIVGLIDNKRKSVMDLLTSQQIADLDNGSLSSDLLRSCLYDTQSMLESATYKDAVSKERILISNYLNPNLNEDYETVRSKAAQDGLKYYADGAVSDEKRNIIFHSLRTDINTDDLWSRSHYYYAVRRCFDNLFGGWPTAEQFAEFVAFHPLTFGGKVIKEVGSFLDTIAGIGKQYARHLLVENWEIDMLLQQIKDVECWRGTAMLHYSISTYVDGDDNIPVEEEIYLRTRGDVLATQRFIVNDFSHSFTADANLSSGQYADLSAFAFKLGQFFLSKK